MSHLRRSHLMHLAVTVLLLQRCCLAAFSSLFFCSSPSKTTSSCFAATSSSSAGHENDGVDGTTKTTTIIANQTFLRPTAQNLQTIQERQVFHKLQPSQVFCVSSPCKHGFPQAFGFHPTNGKKLVSGLFRLSCPLLVQQIDEWENRGGVREATDWLRNDDSGVKRKGYEKANEIQKQIRSELVGGRVGDDYDKLVSRMGEYNAGKFLESGVAGIPPSQTFNVKCLHAHVADHLCRSSLSNSTSSTVGGNVIGEYALSILQNQRGVPIFGNEVCWQQCSCDHEQQPFDWSYVPKKNRQGLRSTRQRRKELREEDN